MTKDIVDFVTNILGIELFEYQKDFLRCIEKIPAGTKITFKRGGMTSPYIYGFLYKKLYEQYQKTGEINLLSLEDNKYTMEDFNKEYTVNWEIKNGEYIRPNNR